MKKLTKEIKDELGISLPEIKYLSREYAEEALEKLSFAEKQEFKRTKD